MATDTIKKDMDIFKAAMEKMTNEQLIMEALSIILFNVNAQQGHVGMSTLSDILAYELNDRAHINQK